MNILFNNKKYLFYTNIAILLLVLFISNGKTFFLNGIPFFSSNEKIFILIIFPILSFFYKDFIYNKIFFLVISIIFLLKILLIYENNLGLNVEQFYKNKQITNYEDIWHDRGLIQNANWSNIHLFPLEWTNYFSQKNNTESKDSSINFDFSKTDITFIISGYIKLNIKENYLIETDGKIIESKIRSLKSQNKKNIFFNDKFINTKDFNFESNDIDKNSEIYEILIKINYESLNKFSHINHFVYDGHSKYSPFLFKKIFNNYNNENIITDVLGNIYDILILVSLFFCVLLILINHKNVIINNINILNLLIILFIFFNSFICYMYVDYLKVFFNELTNEKLIKIINNFFDKNIIFTAYSISIFLISFLFLMFSKKRKTNNLFAKNNNYENVIFFIIIPIIIYFFLNIEKINTFVIHEKGNDWFVFQYFARQIIVYKDYIGGGENILYYRPLSRYLFAFTHYLFGQSLFSQIIIEFWCLTISIYLFSLFFLKLTNYKINICLFSSILLFFYLSDSFKIVLGRGLSEYYALLPIAIITYYFYTNEIDRISYFRLFFLGLVGIIGILFREDHLFVIASLIILSFKFNSYKYLDFINELFLNIYNNFSKIIFYFIIILLSFLILYLRNYYISGLSSLDHYNISGHKMTYFEMLFNNIYLIIFGNNYPGIMRFFSIITFFSLPLVFYHLLIKINFIKIPHIKISIIIVAILIPYFYVAIWGYPPRYSIHLLPFSLILVSLFIFDLYNKISNYEKK